MGLFRRKRSGTELTVRLNARLQPMHRGELFEDPLDDHLTAAKLPASVTGGGTQLSAEGEAQFCDIDVLVEGDDPEAVVPAIRTYLESLGVPRGSSILDEDGSVLVTFGSTEGLALYLNGTDLPAEVYAASDVNELVDAVEEALGDSGRMLSYWEGPRDTALYLYGRDAALMRSRLAPVLESRADAQLSRLEAIA